MKEVLVQDKLTMKLGWKLLILLVCLSFNFVVCAVSLCCAVSCFVKSFYICIRAHHRLIFSLFKRSLNNLCTQTIY